MPIDPNIPLAGRPAPVATPFQTLGGLMQVRGMQIENNLNQAKVREAQMKEEAYQRSLESQQIVTKLTRDPAAQKAFGAGDYSPLSKAGVSYDVQQDFIEKHQKARESELKIGDEDNKQYTAARQRVQDAAENILEMYKDAPEVGASQWNSFAENMAQEGRHQAQVIGQFPRHVAPGELIQRLNDATAGNGMALSILQHGAERRSKLATTEKTEAETEKIGLEARGLKATADLAEEYRKNPTKGVSILHTILDQVDPASLPGYQAQWQNAIAQGDMKGAETAIKDASAHAGQLRKELNPAARAAKISDAATQARLSAEATEGSRLRTFTKEQAIRQKVDDEDLDFVANQLAVKGDLTPLRQIASLRGDQRIRLYAKIKRLNPGYDTSQVDRAIDTQKYYLEPGQGGAKALQSFDTFLQHAGAAHDSIQQLKTTNSKLVNRSVNWMRKNMSGSRELADVQAALEPVRKELEGFLLGGRALYADDRAQAEKILSDDDPIGVQLTALRRMGHTAEARFTAENFKYRRAVHADIPEPFSPEAIEGARKIGIHLKVPEAGGAPPVSGATTGTINVRMKDGRVGPIDADQLQKFLTDHPGSEQVK